MDVLFKRHPKEKLTQIPELTKWWNQKGEKIPEFCERLADLKVDVTSDIDTIWEHLRLIPPIYPDEVKKALHKMSNKKAIGPDGIPVEAWKCLGLTYLFGIFEENNILSMLFSSKMPKAWRLSTIVPIYKGKGSKYECNIYRGIKLLSHTKTHQTNLSHTKRLSSCPSTTQIQTTVRFPSMDNWSNRVINTSIWVV
ncbi:unnamed protein product [Parnassius apollo]|uniref:(apollo) hypothetical protein n=1 Tax=Parnassius apollo TaxID=110799 RepID=A0A8S3Y4M4_PARAO|nr:unnamed protein product [Parnassius apollo]